jgi:DNA-directed RNA polymerase specialized sigma24 family protein
VKMFSVGQAKQDSASHAVARDFCRIFKQDMDRLYLLSYLLTADRAMAEKCFVGGLEDSAKSPRVFKEWAQSWARRMIVQNAIQMIQPQPGDNPAANQSANGNIAGPAQISAVVGLPAFERFVFVMSVLERYSDQDCALLLNTTREEVIVARTRALQRLGDSAESQHAPATPADGSGERLTQEVAGMLLTLVPRLVPSA